MSYFAVKFTSSVPKALIAKYELEQTNEKEVSYKNDDISKAMQCKPLIYILSQAAFN